MSARPKKILFLMNDPRFLLSHRLELACAFRDAGYQVHVLASPHLESELVLAREQFTFHSLPITRCGMNPFKELLVNYHIWKAFRRVQTDVVYLVSIKSVLYGGLIARLSGVPAALITISGMGYVFINKTLKARLLQHVVKRVYRLALGHTNCRVIFQNPDDMRYFFDRNLVDPSKTVLIGGAGVDLRNFTPAASEPAEPVRVTMVARLLRDKGVMEFVEAAKIVRSQGHDVRFTLVGDIDTHNPASLKRSQVNAIMAEGHVECLGHRKDVADIYRDSHIACLPSYREGLPKALLEALACGLPIVTTDVPGCREVVDAGQNGYLVAVKDAQALSESIIRLAKDANLRQGMRAHSRAKADAEFGIHTVVDTTLQLLREVNP
ncbi:MAG: glycosyltransferase family 4 protein [Rickettsiales bacterium]|nr:glycosyltransferase family 4 protein [Rickettsiales bacterium]